MLTFKKTTGKSGAFVICIPRCCFTLLTNNSVFSLVDSFILPRVNRIILNVSMC